MKKSCIVFLLCLVSFILLGAWLKMGLPKSGKTESRPENVASRVDPDEILRSTFIPVVVLPEQSFEDRVISIQSLAREHGITGDQLIFEWGEDLESQGRKSLVVPTLEYKNISLRNLLLYSIDNRGLKFKYAPGKVILLDALAE